MVRRAAAPGEPMGWKYRPGSIVCCIGPGNFYAEICAPYVMDHTQWWVRGLFEDNTHVVDDDNINVISADELNTIRTWMEPYRSRVPHENILGQPVHRSPFQVPHECSHIGQKGKRSGRFQRPPLRYVDRQGDLQTAELPQMRGGMVTRIVNQ